MRAVIWAGVSSRPQVEDKDSLPRQLAEGEQLCQRNGWQIVARLQVPGATRNYVDLADAIAGLDDDLRRLRLDVPNAYRELANLITGRQLDILVVRSRDRLARTDSLIAGIEERLRRSGATLYSMAMPPTGQRAGDFYVSAIERASAQHELERLRERHEKGMDDRLRRGLPLTGPVPFPYLEVRTLRGNRSVRHAVPDPKAVEAYRWAVDATLRRTHSAVEIGERLAISFPERVWSPPSLRDILKNATQVGLVVRRRSVHENEQGTLIVYEPLDTPYWAEIEQLLLHRAEVDRIQAERNLETPRLWLVNAGEHEAVIDPETWLDLQRLLDRRSAGRRPPSRNRLWSGLLWCARCGTHMYAGTSSQGTGKAGSVGVYMCAERFRNHSCSNPQVAERKITRQMLAHLEALVSDLPAATAASKGSKHDPQKELERQRGALAERRARLLLLFETGRIDLAAYDQRILELDREQSRIQKDINALAERTVREVQRARTLAQLAESKPRAILEGDPAAANRWLRGIISKIWVDSGRITSVEL